MLIGDASNKALVQFFFVSQVVFRILSPGLNEPLESAIAVTEKGSYFIRQKIATL
jgi:hypothetical protein